LSNVLAITAGWAHSAALKSDGTVVVWGSIPYGLNGDASTNYSTVPVTEEPSVLVNWEPPTITVQPFSQEVLAGDDVTFSVVATGTNLTYQWNLEGTPISGANASVYTANNVQSGGNYTVTVGTGLNSVVSTNAVLTVYQGTGDPLLMAMQGQRLDYTFKSGMTYYIGSPIQLFGNTTIEAGAVLKLDFDCSTNSSLLVMGGLTCKTAPYNPAILTSIDDDSAGEWIYFSSGSPQAVISGVPYLDLTLATSNSLSNLRFLFADWGVTTPVNTPRLDVWDCQFVDCNYAVVNFVAAQSTNSLHNVLFAGCKAGVAASTNTVTVQGEQVTADVRDFCLAATRPQSIALTNSIVWGNSLSASEVATANVAMNPSHTNFTHVGEGRYYLAANSSFHAAGTTCFSARLQTEFQNKSTCPPIAVAANTQISGQITLSPQAPRYTNGAPDLGYYYDALDYTVAGLSLSGGSLTVLPGTAIGVRNEYIWQAGYWTDCGIYVNQGGSITSHGTPTKPNVLTAADLVQEKPNINFAEYQVEIAYFYGDWLPGIATIITDFEPGDPASPSLDFRFCHFYLPSADLHLCSGMSYDDFWVFSTDSSVSLNLQDCAIHNGSINIGQPYYDYINYFPDSVYGSGTVTWKNTLFENVSINLDPTYYEFGWDDQGNNVDLSVQAHNNLFRGGQWFHLEPIPASAGDWVFEDNLFDMVNIVQDINSGQNQPLDYDYNGYWPLSTNALTWDSYFYPWYWLENTSELQPTATTNGFSDGQNEVTLNSALPYQAGPFGHFYLPTNTALYGAGSDTAANLGLYHYTTRVDQIKEGEDAAKVNANIGLHYIAATNGVPTDFDGDGIPDYVENWHGDGDTGANRIHTADETDWQNAMTDGFTPDPSNSVYLDIDLSGDGLVGRVKAALGMNPLDSSNPLILQQLFAPDNFLT
jgi:hypothetical protein